MLNTMRFMPSKNPQAVLKDIQVNITLARQFTANLSFDEFVNDRKTVYAVIRALEIISEASRRLPDAIKKRYPNIPWQDIAGAGNIYRHDYEEVVETMIWQTIYNALPILEKAIQQELNNLQ